MLDNFAIIKNALGDDADRAAFIFVTIDPENDTQEHLKEALASIDPSFIGLWGSDEQTAQVLDNYGITFERTGTATASTDCQFDYEERVYLIDTNGKLRVTYLPGTDPQEIAQDIEHLASE